MLPSSPIFRSFSPSWAETLPPWDTNSLSPPQPPITSNLFFVSMNSPILVNSLPHLLPHVGWITQYLSFFVWLTSLSRTSSRFIQVVAWVSIPPHLGNLSEEGLFNHHHFHGLSPATTTALLTKNRHHDRRLLWGVPVGSMVKESTSQFQRHGFDPWSWMIPHAVELLSPCATMTERML